MCRQGGGCVGCCSVVGSRMAGWCARGVGGCHWSLGGGNGVVKLFFFLFIPFFSLLYFSFFLSLSKLTNIFVIINIFLPNSQLNTNNLTSIVPLHTQQNIISKIPGRTKNSGEEQNTSWESQGENPVPNEQQPESWPVGYLVEFV